MDICAATRRLAIVLLLIVAPRAEAHAQSQAPARARSLAIQVRDSSGRAVDGAEVSILEKAITLAHRTTGADGTARASWEGSGAEIEVITRRVGYRPSYRFVVLAAQEPQSVLVVLSRIAARLDTVRVTATQDLQKKLLYADADAIANSPRRIESALDVVDKLRPNMVYGLAGRGKLGCPPARYVWVNGVRIRNAVPDLMLQARREEIARARFHPPPPLYALPVDVLSVLATIKPEHVESMEMRDCGDLTVDKPSANGAIFVTLKEGIRFETGRGSFVDSSAALFAAEAIARNAALQASTTSATRRRYLVGVYDIRSGAPVEGATVEDTGSGVSVTTSSTGTALMDVVAPVTLVVRIGGYRTQEVRIEVGGDPTLTILLVPETSGSAS